MGRVHQSLLGAAAWVASSGCSLLVDTSGFDNAAGSVTPVETLEAGTEVDAGGSSSGKAEGGASSEGGAACPTGAFFCDDFESGMGAWSEHNAHAGRATLDIERSHSPTHALHARGPIATDSTSSNYGILRRDTPLRTTGMIVLRAFLYFPATLDADTTVVKWRASGGEDMNLKVDDQGRFLVDSDVKDEGVELSASEAVPTGRWICVEWRATLGTPGHQLVLVDKKPVLDADDNNQAAVGYSSIDLGLVSSDPKLDQQVFFDDVVVADRAVPCP